MAKVVTDVDIDVADRLTVLSGLQHISAKLDGVGKKHLSGVYFQPIPFDPEQNMSNIDYKVAEELGYMKIDLLNVSIYEQVRSEEHLKKLIDKEPNWSYFEHKQIVQNLFHLGNYADLAVGMKPKSVEQLAMLLAVIRPSKYHLQYKPWDIIAKTVWDKPSDGSYHFKKAHAISYALAIVVQLNLLEEEAEQEPDPFKLFS
ncbi:hypothetical protein RVBP17_1300 [Pseudomonas phage sp. 30-3]|uniref:Uncharacterized protein n=1 Tax=Pseudomonas phage vB_PaeM_PA5oct TaxID=2163605 RepID=A0A4Y5JVF7_9CAUD|nr:hypothetical protein PQE65_gp264 [Pseudomonas phage vB_PaeM_PA5oct]WMI31764.1 hypothetical protein GBBBJNDB_00061 [Pseudomonas phage Callisto]WPK38693.1 DNA polymerase [Pseudomonas phage Cassandra]WPK39214.1 DNA polymerase [Pseudomonas phage Deifobo]WPK39726.1 DNA polymerase [Pseudomonas phage Ettore]WPK40247.1 DNA polymerase [Pseudomonas phage Paride]VOH53822.1 hypothetical protein MIJ3_00061 [Pseudomonas phage vB_PaeM_MIJ3]BDR25827.1 hypothetical protein RVBP16_2670 [Pseudomonas phage s